MKKQTYLQPEITVVDFKVEHCFVSSLDSQLSTQKFGDFKSMRYDSYDNYSTSNETFTDYTDWSGNCAGGSWGNN